MTWEGFELERSYRAREKNDKRVTDRQDKRWDAHEYVRALLRGKAPCPMDEEHG